MDEITDARRRALEQSIRVIDMEELKALGERLFPFHDDPWRQNFFNFLEENPHETFHHGVTNDDIQIVYCQAKNRGIWFVPGKAAGPLQARGLGILNEIVSSR